MCGIFVALSRTRPIWPTEEHQRLLQSRGPDATGRAAWTVKYGASEVYCTFYSTVLALRGDHLVGQPLHDPESKSTLCWNGEAWTVAGKPASGNDTSCVWHLLNTNSAFSKTGALNSERQMSAMAEKLSTVAGPYSFVYGDSSVNTLFLGRDFLGRRSLVKHITANGDLFIASVPDDLNTCWEEVEADGLYSIDLSLSRVTDTSVQHDREMWGSFVASRTLYKFRDLQSPQSVIPHLSLNNDIPHYILSLNSNSPAVLQLEEALHRSLNMRITSIFESQRSDVSPDGQSTVAILFSGGLDCSTLARMSHSILPSGEPVDLLNVAFENPRVLRNMTGTDTPNCYEVCPDRITGRKSCEELRKVCSERDWRFVEINVPYHEARSHRQTVVGLMSPHNTEMDLSISYALYFAARGQGMLNGAPYRSTPRVLLSGLGADELFGGYARHASAFKRGGFTSLADELALDVARLGKRNLGRDDRIISHWGREARYPFLDEDLLSWALSVPVTEKCGFGLTAEPSGQEYNDTHGAQLEPDKKVLRCLAQRLGLMSVAKEKKRAIQFGARTAKMETGKIKGPAVIS